MPLMAAPGLERVDLCRRLLFVWNGPGVQRARSPRRRTRSFLITFLEKCPRRVPRNALLKKCRTQLVMPLMAARGLERVDLCRRLLLVWNGPGLQRVPSPRCRTGSFLITFLEKCPRRAPRNALLESAEHGW